MCGEKGGPHRAGHPPRGSPPRVRGKAEWENLIGSDVRITPACAGKRRPPLCASCSTWDHPRVCGEKSTFTISTHRTGGSPPRMRGKVVLLSVGWLSFGITPAYAGKSGTGSGPAPGPKDHPRVCGEKIAGAAKNLGSMGSPPRMRGKVTLLYALADKEGITPAYAGKRHYDNKAPLHPRDHPRVCGEKWLPYLRITQLQGSPPRMRGKGTAPPGTVLHLRITPAYAGKSVRPSCRRAGKRDHPRVCGEKLVYNVLYYVCKGSPPRMRGKERLLHRQQLVTRITPAYAGKRLKRSHRIGHFSCILCLFHSVLHRASASGGSRAGPCAPPCLPAQNAVPV